MAEIKKLFTQVINKYAPISPRVLEMLFPLFEIYTIENGNEIVSQGKINSKEYFLLSGILREFTFDENGNETSLDFYLGESIIVPNFCRTKNFSQFLKINKVEIFLYPVFELQALPTFHLLQLLKFSLY